MKPQPQDAREKAWDDLLDSNIPFSGKNGLSNEIFNRGYDAGYADGRDDWVPIEDALPTEDGKYWVTTESGRVATTLFCPFRKNKWDTVDDVIAWQEYYEPNPYRQQAEEKIK